MIVVGAGVGGLVAAALLARAGVDVTVLERADHVGGKMREVVAGGRRIDAGPTVLTMRWVFDEIFAELGERLEDHVTLARADRIARHAFVDGSVLDLYASLERSAVAVEAFAGPAAAAGYRRFCAYAKSIYDAVELPFLRADRLGPRSVLRAARQVGLPALLSLDGHRTLWKALGDFFPDARLRQLFGRYATYCGSSPFQAPATLNVIAHVEREGVYLVHGGMHRLAVALASAARRAGAIIRTGAAVRSVTFHGSAITGVRLEDGDHVPAGRVIVNADAEAVARGLLGGGAMPAARAPATRSLSAITWALPAETRGFPLVRHNVFFSSNYLAEFEELFERGLVPREPTIYVCAQDRDDDGVLDVFDARDGVDAVAGAPKQAPVARGERLLVLINAPPSGDDRGPALAQNEVRACESRCIALMERMGLSLREGLKDAVVTTPRELDHLFPGTGGALYGPASHGMMSAFARRTSRTKVPGLYLCGGSVHPGPGVPMVALSGRHAAASVIADLASTSRSRGAATRGGTATS